MKNPVANTTIGPTGYSDDEAFGRARIQLRMDIESVLHYSHDVDLQHLQVLAGKIALSTYRICGCENSAFNRFFQSITISTLRCGIAVKDLRVGTRDGRLAGLLMQDLPMMDSSGKLVLSLDKPLSKTKWLKNRAFTVILIQGANSLNDSFAASYDDSSKSVILENAPQRLPNGDLSFLELDYADILKGVRHAQGAHDRPPDGRRVTSSSFASYLLHHGSFAVRWYISALVVGLGLTVHASLENHDVDMTLPFPVLPPHGRSTVFPSGMALHSGTRMLEWGNCSGPPTVRAKLPSGKLSSPYTVRLRVPAGRARPDAKESSK